MNRRNFLLNSLKLTLFTFFISIFNIFFYKQDNLKVISKKFFSMGTQGVIKVLTIDEKLGILSINRTIKKIKKLDCLLTKFSINSEIGIINNNKNMNFNISKNTFKIVKLSLKLNHLTKGFFDVFMLKSNLKNLKDVEKNYYNDKILNIDNKKIKILKNNYEIDLGGIGKGFAIEESIKILKKNKIENVIIELGGDIGFNKKDNLNKSWIIKKTNIKKNEQENIKFIKNGGISVSGNMKNKKFTSFKKSLNHIINPITLKYENYYSNLIVSGPSSTICDALSTAGYNMSPSKINILKKKFKNYEFKYFYK